MALQQSLNHPFIANLKGIQQDARSLYLVMDFIDGGELYKLIQQREKLDIGLARFYASQIILTFEYLHGKNLIYRDLKPENVLLDEDGYACLADFGLAKYVKG
jgi:protein kinase A